MLGGLLFVRPEGYAEAQRDVVRLTSDVELLREQEGYITCEPLDPEDGGPLEPLPLHCSLLVIPAQVQSLPLGDQSNLTIILLFHATASSLCWSSRSLHIE